MEYNRNVRTSSSSHNINKRFFRAPIREYKNYQYLERRSDENLDHMIKRNLKGTNVNSDILSHHNIINNNINDNNINNNNNNNGENVANANINNNNNLITYEHLSESSWLELVLPFTILAITIISVILIAVILFIWIQKYFRETREKSQIIDSKIQQLKSTTIYCTKKRCDKLISNNNRNNKMNSRKWLKGKSNKKIDNQIVSDLEQKLETIEFKSTPPTSPNSQKLDGEQQKSDEDDEIEQSANKNINTSASATISNNNNNNKSLELRESDAPSPTFLPCPLALSDISITSVIQPPQTPSAILSADPNATGSSLSLLQEEVILKFYVLISVARISYYVYVATYTKTYA